MLAVVALSYEEEAEITNEVCNRFKCTLSISFILTIGITGTKEGFNRPSRGLDV